MTNHLHASRDNINSLLSAISQESSAFQPIQIQQALANAYKIALCNDRENQWHGCETINYETGELFNASGRFYRCNQRLCHDCLSNFQRRNRKKIRRLMAEHKQLVGYNYNLITFTVVNHNSTLQESREILERTWQLFRKRKFFKKNFRAGVKTEEFTFTTNGFHYHLHLIADTRYLLYSTLRSEWTQCYLKVAEEFGLNQTIATSDGLLEVNVKKIYESKRSVFEVTKYVTKSSTWASIPAEDLIEYATIKRHPRMTEFFGEWRSLLTPLPDEENECEFPEENTDIKTIVHKESLSDGTFGKIQPIELILENIHQKAVETSVFRLKQIRFKQPHAILSYKKSDKYASKVAELCIKLSPKPLSDESLKALNRLCMPGVRFSRFDPNNPYNLNRV